MAGERRVVVCDGGGAGGGWGWDRVGLAITAITGILLVASLVWVATGAPALRSRVAGALAGRIEAVNGGRPVSLGQAARDVAAGVLLSVVKPVASLRSTDVEWARRIQKQARDLPGPDDRDRLYTLIAATGRWRGEPVAAFAEGRAAAAAERLLLPTADAGTLRELHDGDRRWWRTQLAFVWEALRAHPVRGYGMGQAVALLDHVGRGTAVGLLCGLWASSSLEHVTDVVAWSSLVGGVLGAAAFNFRLLGHVDRAGLPDDDWLARLVRRRWLVLLLPILVSALTGVVLPWATGRIAG